MLAVWPRSHAGGDEPGAFPARVATRGGSRRLRCRRLDEAPAVYPDPPVSDLPGLDRHRRTWPRSGCEFPANVADDRASGVLPGFNPGPPELIGIRLQMTCCGREDSHTRR